MPFIQFAKIDVGWVNGLYITEALSKLQGKVVMQGGLPSVLMCLEGGTKDDLIRCAEDTVSAVQGRKGFILGLANNIPPNADSQRVRIVSEIVNSS